MDGREFGGQIRLAWEFFADDMNLGRAFIDPSSLRIDDQFARVALAPESSYFDIYLAGLSRSAYNFVIRDYSYFQFGWVDDGSWRLAYYPNPWVTGVHGAEGILLALEELEAGGSLAYEETSDLIAELPFRAAVPLIRFEYARDQYHEIAHPAAHLHVGSDGDNRWPCSLLLGPLGFSMMIGRLYYRDAWMYQSRFFPEGESADDCLDLRFIEAVGRTQAVHEFSPREMRSLHIGRNMVPVERVPDHEKGHRRRGPRRRPR